MGVTDATDPKTCHPTPPWFGNKQWRQDGVIEQIMTVLHGQVREQVKKKQSGRH
jgi:hypothetical protein